MGVFIEQVARNNDLQREQLNILTEAQRKEREREQKQEEKELIKLDKIIVREILEAEMDNHFLKVKNADNAKAYFEIIENRNATINKLFTLTTDKEEASAIYYKVLKDVYNQHQKDEEAKAHFEELKENEWTPEAEAWQKHIEGMRQKNIEEQRQKVEEENRLFVEGLKRWAEKEEKKEKQQKFHTFIYIGNWVVNILLLVFCLPLGLLFCFLTAMSKSNKK